MPWSWLSINRVWDAAFDIARFRPGAFSVASGMLLLPSVALAFMVKRSGILNLANDLPGVPLSHVGGWSNSALAAGLLWSTVTVVGVAVASVMCAEFHHNWQRGDDPAGPVVAARVLRAVPRVILPAVAPVVAVLVLIVYGATLVEGAGGSVAIMSLLMVFAFWWAAGRVGVAPVLARLEGTPWRVSRRRTRRLVRSSFPGMIGITMVVSAGSAAGILSLSQAAVGILLGQTELDDAVRAIVGDVLGVVQIVALQVLLGATWVAVYVQCRVRGEAADLIRDTERLFGPLGGANVG